MQKEKRKKNNNFKQKLKLKQIKFNKKIIKERTINDIDRKKTGN